jgi:hypothetical protein
MMQVILRLLWIVLFAVWQGGFMFYGAIVVPVGTRVLGSESLQGFVTQSVTNYLNIIGVLTLSFWLGEFLLCRDASKTRNNTRWFLLITMMLLHGLLAWMHINLDSLLDAGSQVVLKQQQFHQLHSWYLIISTLEWVLSILFAAVTLAAWHGLRRQIQQPCDV